MDSQTTRIALCYLARAADSGFRASLERFARSYSKYAAGADHQLYVIFKGFDVAADLNEARLLLSPIEHRPILVGDDGFDLAAYAVAARQAGERTICFLNTNSEILCEHWLAKLARVLGQGGAGLVGATGSFESRQPLASFPAFPNAHLRSNAFMIDRELFRTITDGVAFESKSDAYLFESGPRSMTRKVLERGLEVLVVGRNGRGYAPRWWPSSGTFRQGAQGNLLVADNQTRAYDAMTWEEKLEFSQRAWGAYIREDAVPARI